MAHRRAKLTVRGRQLLIDRILEEGWSVAAACEAQGVSRTTGHKWIRRFHVEGPAGLMDRTSRPRRMPARLSAEREAAILKRRGETLEGPHRIGWALGEARSTVHRVLRRNGVPRLADLDRATRTVVRYERDRPGELVHVDVKKQPRIPHGGGWRVLGRSTEGRRRQEQRVGFDYLHITVDDRSRVAYVEVHNDERMETAASFMARALGWYSDLGVSVERILTDNGSCYRSRLFRGVLTDHEVVHKRTRPYRPQTMRV